MTRRRAEVQVWREIKKVKLREPRPFSGSDVFSVNYYTDGKEYPVFGAYVKRFSDGETILCLMVQGDDGVVHPTDIERFVVVE